MKTNADGLMEWDRWYDTGSYDKAWAGQQTSDGGYLLAGEADNYESALVVKTNSTGDTLWVRKFGSAGSDERAYAVCELSDSTYVFAGYSTAIDTWDDMYIVGITAAGDEEWSLTFGGSERENATGICVTTDHSVIAVGWTDSYGAGYRDVYLAKIGVSPQAVTSRRGSGSPRFDFGVFPNPFNTSATISYTLRRPAQVTIELIDVLGRQVAKLNDGMLEPGEYKVTVDGSVLPSGIYFARLQSGEFTATQKLLLLR